MSIINSNTTGHSPKQERKFANKLFIGLGVLIAVAFVVLLLTSQNKDMKATPAVEQLPAGQQPLPTEPLPVSPTAVPQPVAAPQEAPQK